MRAVNRSLLALAIGIGGSITLSTSLWAQSWPQSTVKVIIPFAAGGAIDTSARLFAENLAGRWGAARHH